MTLGNFRSEDEDDYDYEFSVLSSDNKEVIIKRWQAGLRDSHSRVIAS